MSQYKKTIVLGLDYSEFSGGITDCNRKMGLLDAEFKLAKEQANNYGTEVDKLTLKKESLSQKISLQTKIVEENKKAYDKALTSGKATEKQTDAMDKKLLEARTTLEKLNGEYDNASKELDEYAKKQDDAGKKMDESNEKQRTFGDTVRGVSDFLGLNANPMIASFASRFDGLNENVGLCLVTLGAMATKLYDCTKAASEYADNVLTLSSITGLSTETLQKMDYAAELMDVSTEQISSSMTKLTKNMGDARDGNKDLQKEFAKLGVKYKEGSSTLKSSEEVFYDIIDALGKVKNETERDVIAMNLFGKSAKELNPLIEAGSKKLIELGNEAERVGYVMDDAALNKLGAFDDAMQRLDKTSEGLKNNLGLALAPVLTDIFSLFSAIPIPVLELMIQLGGMVLSVVMIVKAMKSVTDTGKGVIDFFTGLDAKTLKTTAIVLGVVVALLALATIIAVIMGRSNDLQKSMDSIGDSIGTINQSVQGVQKPKYNARGTNYFEGGETWINEGGPERITLPRGTKIENAQDTKRSSGQVNYYNITIAAKEVKEFNDIIKIVKNEQVSFRKGRVVV